MSGADGVERGAVLAMKRYEFHSSLPPEEVFARLDARTKRSRNYSLQAPEEFLCDRKGEQFRLGYTGIVPARGFVPFCGTVRAEKDGSVVAGGFSLLRETGLPFAVVGGIFWIFGVCTGQPPLPFLLLTAVWLLLLLEFFSIIQLVCFWNRRNMILKFIENNLLK